jgi:hypothetical protein
MRSENRLLNVSLGLLIHRLLSSICFLHWWSSRCGNWLSLLGRGLGHDFVNGGLEDLDGVGEGFTRTELTFGIPTLHSEDEQNYSEADGRRRI